jgi:uracil-DNA glycosylase
MPLPHLPESWRPLLEQELEKPYMQELCAFLLAEQNAGKKLFPPLGEVFRALEASPFDKVKVVILGQDPYHGEGQAHGLSFSVKPGLKIPPSLQNIYKELKTDLGLESPKHGCLSAWATQGVLLLNTVLTVEEGQAGSHRDKGWEGFTDKIIEVLNDHRENLVFILWGGPAQKKASHVDTQKHCVIRSAHPSPLSVYRGFLGSKPFSRCNDYLRMLGRETVDWKLRDFV